MSNRISCLLIAGTSHTGKSTLAMSIGEALGWSILSTDKLARHPGRPWPTVLPPIAEYYARLTSETIYQFLLHHHQNMWPHIRRLIQDHRDNEIPFVLEGSALRPEYIASQAAPETMIVCLHADHAFLRHRMYRQSGYEQLEQDHQAIVDKFIERSLRDNDENLSAARDHGLQCIDARDQEAVDRFRAIISGHVGDPEH
ncbi:MAG: hypothetical protein ACR2QH_09045 [Geminicoccaceae bacterium]